MVSIEMQRHASVDRTMLVTRPAPPPLMRLCLLRCGWTRSARVKWVLEDTQWLAFHDGVGNQVQPRAASELWAKDTLTTRLTSGAEWQSKELCSHARGPYSYFPPPSSPLFVATGVSAVDVERASRRYTSLEDVSRDHVRCKLKPLTLSAAYTHAVPSKRSQSGRYPGSRSSRQVQTQHAITTSGCQR